MTRGRAFVGCAGWGLAAVARDAFGEGGSHLARYASRLGAVEINSSFYRPHTFATYGRWAEAVPPGFRFSVKLPKAITHERKLDGCEALLDAFLAQAQGLGGRLACVLVQLPPSLSFEQERAETFFAALRQRWQGHVALEPRHASWFEPGPDALLMHYRVARVLADPVRVDAGAQPGGWPEFIYLRLHGSPRMYYSAYEPPLIAALSQRLSHELHAGRDAWCIFDNTAGGAAADNALTLSQALDKEPD